MTGCPGGTAVTSYIDHKDMALLRKGRRYAFVAMPGFHLSRITKGGIEFVPWRLWAKKCKNDERQQM